MENKTTTELIDFLHAQIAKDGQIKDLEKYEAANKELLTREPFFDILNPDWDESIPRIFEILKEVQEDVKKLKRHKHDAGGDVLIRI